MDSVANGYVRSGEISGWAGAREWCFNKLPRALNLQGRGRRGAEKAVSKSA